MKALVLSRNNQLDYLDVPEPSVGPDDVLVEIKACGICGSDVHGMDGSTGRRQPPIIMGHEAAGVIRQIGSAVATWKPGDRVTFDSTISCGQCGFCRCGEMNLCDNRRVLGVSCAEYRRDGAMAQYLALPQRILYRLPDALSFEHAAMVEPLAIAAHAASRAVPQSEGVVVVFGAGIIGLLTIQVLLHAGWGKVLAVDIDDDKLELAKKVGAAQTLNSKRDDPVAHIVELTGGQGAHAAFEAVGIETTVTAACRSLRKGGDLVLIGNVSPQVSLPLQLVVTRQITLHGSCASAGEYPACLDLLARNVIDVKSLISGVAPLAEGSTWFMRLRAGEKGLRKVILLP